MSLKMICNEAGVNMGMFNYYFKTKSNFISKVLESISDGAKENAELKAPDGASSIERLRHFLISMGNNFRDHRKIALAMYGDLLNQDPDVSAFVIRTSEKQTQFLQPLIEECQKDGYIDKEISVDQVMVFCKSAVNSPIILSEALERIKKSKSKLLPKEIGKFTSNEAIAQRVDMAIRGIAVVKREKS
jgi:AcrR family transcriptional regulator